MLRLIPIFFGVGLFTALGLTKRNALRDVMVDRCAGGGGRCWCRSAETCLFHRCSNCDMPVDENGKAGAEDRDRPQPQLTTSLIQPREDYRL